MLLSSIQIQGFKSFADKTTLKFGKGITGIVGPNGSGKSNISDAVRWVLGEQSTKNLRGQSMEDVIFGGTAARRPHGFCEVTLNIDNTDRSLNFDDDYVSVTRRYYRSHESEYLINNVSVRLKDINELFMDTGLGRDGYSMVGQGKIDAIISTKSNERRDIFEEASGISKYRYRKLESERKLAAADENLLRLKDIMAELEGRVEPLKIQSEKAEKFLSLAEQKKNLEIGLWLHTLANFKQALRDHENKITACSVLYKEIEDKLTEFDSEVEKNSSLYNEYTVAIEEKRSDISAYGEQIAVLGGNIQVTENDIQHNNSAVEKTLNEIESLKNSEESTRAQITQNLDLAEAKRAETAELEKSISAAESGLNELLLNSENFSREIEKLSAALNELSVKNSDLRVQVLTSESSAEEIKARAASLDELIKEKNDEISELKGELDDTLTLISSTESTMKDCENSLKGYELRYDSRKEKNEKLHTELDNIHLDIEAKKRRAQILADLEKNMEGFNYSVKSIMQIAESGVLRGVHGPVASIIGTKKEFTVAIETALGGALQNIVVDTDADAKRCISHLKKNNAGRATFLSVADIKARPFKDNGVADAFGYVGIASELVETDKKYREIIEYLLGAVVVAEDLDSAVAIAKKFNYAFKVVSLDGQVVNAGGSMTGGSLIKNAGLLSRKEDIKKLNDDIKKAEEKEKLISADYEKSCEDLKKVEADIVTAKDVLKTASEDNIRAVSEKKRIEELINAANELCSRYETEKSDGAAKCESLAAAAETAKAQIEKIEQEKNALQQEIDSKSGGRDELTAKREEITESITAIKLKIVEINKDRENLIISAKTLEEALSHRDERVAELEKEKQELEKLNETKLADIDAVNETISAIRLKISETEKEIEEIGNKRNDIEKQSALLRSTEKDKTLEREKLGGELARLTERKENMVAEYDNVIRQLYDEYNLTRTEAEALGIEIESPAEAKKELSSVKNSIKNLGTVNVSAIEEYKEVSERYEFMSAQIADVESSRAELNKLINQLTGQMQEMFTVGFARINECFSKTFTELFGGGTASLVLTDPDNVLESGIDIVAKLPGKNVPSLDGLSGGEKALVALSIYFAIMFVNAPPFCFLDEVDTALDDINVERFARYMKKSEVATQFICVTHRRGTMEAADMLYGVTMQEKGVTKLLELNVSELEKKLSEVDN